MIPKNIQLRLLLLFVVLLGAGLRFQGLDWDSGYHLQPDERYISMVLSSLSPPKNLTEYFDPNRSSLSPYIHNFGAYIYGQLPLTVLTYSSRWLGMDGYDKTYLLGRAISAMLDTLSIVLVYKLGKRLWNEKTGVIGAGFYAFAPLAIQYSHFMTMESWLTFFWLLIILLLTRLPRDVPYGTSLAMTDLEKFRKLLKITGIGVLLGAATAVKASSAVLAAVVSGWIILASFQESPGEARRLLTRLKRILLGSLGSLGILGMTAMLSFRLFQPTIFASASWLDWWLRQDFYQAFNFQRLAIDGKVMFPPQWQWVNTPQWWFPLKNIVLWGMGPAAGGLMIIGVIREFGWAPHYAYLLPWSTSTRRKGASAGFGRTSEFSLTGKFRSVRRILRLLIAAWIAAVFFWQGGKFVKNMRYFLPFFPLYALFAASVFNFLKRTVLARTVLFVGMGVSFLWAIMFTNIYRLPTTRVAASEWIYQNIPAGSKIMLEEWDDPLPLVMSGYEMFDYQTEMVGVYAVDDEKKREQINRWMRDFDWIVLSSPRAKGSIGKLAKEFPQMSKFYRDLDSGSLGFAKMAEFTSYPTLSINDLRLTINDSSAEESFWVYDHPRVEIYKKS